MLHESQLQRSSQLILERRPDLTETVFPILMQRHPHFTLEQQLATVTGKPVDLVMVDVVRNPYVRRDIEALKQLFFWI